MPGIGVGVSPMFQRSRPGWRPRVVLINGQSNAASAPPLYEGFSAITRYLGADLLGWSDVSHSFVPLVDGAANMRANAGGFGVGAGPAAGQLGTLFARLCATAYAHTVKVFGLAFTSQGIAYFQPGCATKAYYEDSSQHATLNNYNLLATEVGLSNERVDTILWCQGEADAGSSQATHYAALNALVLAWHVTYPKARVLIVTTIGTQGDYAGVRAAQLQVASEHAWVHIVDTTDMEGNTAWFGDGVVATHYTDYAGPEEVARRCFAVVQGTTRPAVAALDHALQVMTWQHAYLYRYSVTMAGSKAQSGIWWDDIGVASLNAIGGPSIAEHVSADADFGYRTVSKAVAANAERFATAAPIAGDSSKWSLFLVAKSDSVSAALRVLGEVQCATGRLTLFATSAAGVKPGVTLSDGDHVFASAPDTDTAVHTYGVALDDSPPSVVLYLDGVMVERIALTAAETITAPTVRACCQDGNVGYFDGRMSAMFVASGHTMTRAEAHSCHDWARIEYACAASPVDPLSQPVDLTGKGATSSTVGRPTVAESYQAISLNGKGVLSSVVGRPTVANDTPQIIDLSGKGIAATAPGRPVSLAFWTPALLSPAIWLQSDYDVVMDGVGVEAMGDLSGNNRGVAQPTAPNRFLYDGSGAYPWIVNDGAAVRYLTRAALPIGPGYTCALVKKNASYLANETYFTNGSTHGASLWAETANNGNYWIRHDTGPIIRVDVPLSTDVERIVWGHSGAAGSPAPVMDINGTPQTCGSLVAATTPCDAQFDIGYSGYQPVWKWACFIMFDGLLSAANRGALERWLAWKY